MREKKRDKLIIIWIDYLRGVSEIESLVFDNLEETNRVRFEDSIQGKEFQNRIDN